MGDGRPVGDDDITVEMLGTAADRSGRHGPAPGRPDPPARRSRWLAVPALAALALAVLLIGSGGPDTVAPRPPPTTPRPTPPPVDGDDGGWHPAGDLLVSTVAAGLFVVDTADGSSTVVALDRSPTDVAPGPGRSVFVHYRLGRVDLVDLVSRQVSTLPLIADWFVPSATPGRVWLRAAGSGTFVETDGGPGTHTSIHRSDRPGGDPRLDDDGGDLRLHTPGGVVDLGERRVAAVSASSLYAYRCDGPRCDLERFPLDGAGDWTPVVARPGRGGSMRASPDDRWLAVTGDVLSVYRTDTFGVFLVHTGAPDALFSPDGADLYLVTSSQVEVIDLVGERNRSVDLPPLPAERGPWILVPVGAGGHGTDLRRVGGSTAGRAAGAGRSG